MKHTQIEKCYLSTGQLTTLSKFGKTYGVMVTSTNLFDAPELWSELSKNEAYEIYEGIMRSDVME